MVSTRGKVHEYLGTTIDFSDTSKVKITMYDYVDEMIKELPTEKIVESATPAANYVFEIRNDGDDDQLLTPELSEELHHLVAKTLFSIQAGTIRSTDCCSIFHHKSKSTWQWWSKEAF